MRLVLFFLGLFAIALAILWGLWETRTGLFVGRFHSLLIHFPIALLISAGALEAYSALVDRRNYRDTIRLMLTLALASSIAASISGFLLSLEGGFSQNTLYWHLRLGLLFTFGTGISLLLDWARSKSRSRKVIQLHQFSLALTILALLAAGHLGGKMAHGPDYLTEYLPQPFREIVGSGQQRSGEVLNLESTLFEAMVRPVLDQNCVDCHGAGRSRGGLRLDTHEGIEMGGKSGPVIIESKPDASELVRRTLLPIDHDELMPPEGNEPLDFGDVEIIRWWISEGASFDRKLREIVDSGRDLPFAVEAYLERHLPATDTIETAVFELAIAAASPEDIDKARELGFKVRTLSRELDLLTVRFPAGRVFSRRKAQYLEGLAPQIVWLDLSGVILEEGASSTLGQLPHLVRLNVSETNVADEDLTSLANLKFLEYLNLYGTDVTDQGTQHLANLRSLKKLYLWNTGVTERGVKALRGSLPECAIDRGSEPDP